MKIFIKIFSLIISLMLGFSCNLLSADNTSLEELNLPNRVEDLVIKNDIVTGLSVYLRMQDIVQYYNTKS